MCGLRAYPLLSATNRASLTLTGNRLAAPLGTVAGTVDIPYVNILVDRLTDDVFGVQPTSAQSPYSRLPASLRRATTPPASSSDRSPTCRTPGQSLPASDIALGP